MEAIEILIAKSLAASLSAAKFYGPIDTIDAVFSFVPDYSTEELSDLRVSVVPGTIEVSNHTHGADLYEYEIHVVIGKKFTSNAELEDLVELRSEIVDAIRSRTLPPSSPPLPAGVAWMGVTNAVTYDRDQVTGQRVCLADIVVTYRRANAKVGQ